MNKRERKRLRKGISMSELPPIQCEGIPRANLEAAIQEAKDLSYVLAGSRPKETAWVYRFHVPGKPVAWVGVRHSEGPYESSMIQDGYIIRLDPIIGYRNGERINPLEVHNVHGFKDYQVAAIKEVLGKTPSGKILMSFPSNDLVEKYRAYFRKKFSKD